MAVATPVGTGATGALTGLAQINGSVVLSSLSGLYVLKQTGPGAFVQTILAGANPSTAVAVGDIDGDGFDDIIALTFQGDIDAWTTGPLFAGPPVVLGNVGFADQGGLAVVGQDDFTDLNEDGFNDIVATNGFDANTMEVLLQNPSSPRLIPPAGHLHHGQ